MLEAGGQFEKGLLHNGAVATGDGAIINPVQKDDGARNKLAVQLQGITTATVTWKCSLDGTNYKGFLMTPTTSTTGALTATADGIYRGDVTGFRYVKAEITGWTEGAITATYVLTVV